ncbi:MAG TPA: LysR substrate-binding domain-containing protein [Rhodocyclaceae bacterium]|nr:LysR substrate-binding domain-containing protein [Rhodocyclaceae bacterium]
MRLRQIEVFRATMMAGSVSEAARMLHVSQPVVSRVLRHAEIGLGFALFERVRGRLVPTPEARALLAQVERAWGEIERIEALSRNLRRGASGLLRVAATPSLATSLLPGALVALRASNPGVECDLWASHTREIETHLLAFEVDLGVAIEPPEQPGLLATPLARGQMLLAAPREWGSGVLRLNEFGWLCDRPFIALAEATPLGERLAAVVDGARVAGNRVLSVQTYALAGTLVEQGLGYAFVDSYTAAVLDPRRVILLRLAPTVDFALCLMRNAGAPGSILISRLEVCLKQAAEDRMHRLQGLWGADVLRLS